MPINKVIQSIENGVAAFNAWHESLRVANKAFFWIILCLKKASFFVFGTLAGLCIADQWPNLHFGWRGWFMTTVRWALGLIIFSVLFYLHSRKEKAKGLQIFWWPWFLVLWVLVLFLIIRVQQHHAIANLNSELESTNDNYQTEITTENKFFADVTNHDSKIIEQWREYFRETHPQPPTAEMMGFEQMTNYYQVTNIFGITNIVEIDKTNVIMSLPFVLDLMQMERVQEKLASVKPVPVLVIYSINDPEAYNLAKQIGQIFLAAKFGGVAVLGPSKDKFPFNRVTIASKTSVIGTPIWGAFLQLFAELNQGPQTDIETNLPDGLILILVTTTQK